MRLREYVREHRAELDDFIREAIGQPDYVLNDAERENWVQNVEPLYLDARRSGWPG